MCLIHDPELKKKWLPKKRFIAYKVIIEDREDVYQCSLVHVRGYHNTSVHYWYEWTVGIHEQSVRKLDDDGRASSGFYVYLDKKTAFEYSSSWKKVIAVHVKPEDMIYAGIHAEARVAVCRKLTVKSMRPLKKASCVLLITEN